MLFSTATAAEHEYHHEEIPKLLEPILTDIEVCNRVFRAEERKDKKVELESKCVDFI
jgi:hypothetical protein